MAISYLSYVGRVGINFQLVPHRGISTGGTYTGFMCTHCLGAGSECSTAPRQKEITACNIQLVTITPTQPRFNIRTIFHIETEIVQNMGLL